MVIFSGIQPTGRKHLGNYIGAIVQYVAGQDRADPAIYCIVDLHAITVPYDPAELRERTYDTTAILIAAGLDPDRCLLFRQGDVQEHTELTLAADERHRRSASSTGCTSSATSRPRSARWSRPASSTTRCCRPPTSSPIARTRCPSARTSASTSS